MNRNISIILSLAMTITVGRIFASGTTNPAAATNSTAATNPTPVKVILPRIARVETAAVQPSPAKVEAKDDFKAFQLITERNIFDMTRTGAHIRTSPVYRPKVDDFTLVGTMSYEKGVFAFFDGSSSEYRQQCKTNGTIAGYKVMAIGSDYAELQSTNGKVVKMLVGTTIRREDKGPWSAPSTRADAILADAGTRSRDRSDGAERGDRGDRSSRNGRRSRGDRASSTGDAAPSPAEPGSDASSGGSQDDIVKRLMEKRAKEVKDNQ